MKMIKWPSIEQFRNVIRNVQHQSAYAGQDENGEAIFNRHAPKPTLHFEGTIKLHGTNAAVCWDRKMSSDIWAQSRENILTIEQDNAGFASFTHSHVSDFKDLLTTALGVYGYVNAADIPYICIFGEWCGGNIQKGVAITGLPKMFVIIGIALADEEGNKTYFTRNQVKDVVDGCREYIGVEHSIKTIWDFPTFQLDIDFERPELSQNTLGEITEQVERSCPVGFALGQDGVGEGVVWRCTDPGYDDSSFWFKVKGEKHSASKVKTLAAVDIERVNSIKECVENIVTESRLNQGLEHLTQNQLEHVAKNMGPFLQWISGDLAKEELDTITGSGLEFKEVVKEAQRVARNWFLKQIGV